MYESLIIQSFCAALTLVLLICNRLEGKRTRKNTLIHIMLALNLLRALFCACAIALEKISAPIWLICVFLAAMSSGYLMLACFSLYVRENLRDPACLPVGFIYAAIALNLLQVLLYIASAFVPLYFTLGSGCIGRGPLYWVEPMLVAAAMLLNAVMVIRCRGQLNKYSYRALMSYMLMPLLSSVVAAVCQNADDVMTMGLTMSLMIIYLINHLLAEKLRAEEEEMIIHTKVELLMSQVKPHFIFNALATITYLYEAGKPNASRIMSAFCKYLRNALDFDHQSTLSTFQEDLDHLDSYVTIERVRFPDTVVEYKFEATDFELPFYTMQPLVENAIKHGTRPTGTGGHVIVATRETDSAIELSVTDDGIGFVPWTVPDDGKRHLGLVNTRARVEQLCGGTMEVISSPGKGARVTIRLPKNKKHRTA